MTGAFSGPVHRRSALFRARNDYPPPRGKTARRVHHMPGQARQKGPDAFRGRPGQDTTGLRVRASRGLGRPILFEMVR